MAERQYPFPSRTRKSSSPAPMIVPSRRESRWLPGFFLFKSFRLGWGPAVPAGRVLGSHLRRTAPAPSEPDCIDEPKKRWRVFLDGSSILGRLPGFFLPFSLFCGLWPSLFCWGLCLPRRLVRNYMEPFRAVPAMRVPAPAAACGVATQSLRARLGGRA